MGRTEIRGGQIKDETVDSADIASGSIKAGEISVQAITGQPSLDPADATNDRLLIWDSGADTLKKVSPENLGVTAAAAGSDGQVQYNNGGTATGGASGLYWDDANDRVGIGTSTPAYTLDVAGDIGGDGSITVANSVTASNGIKSDGVNQFTGGSCFSPPVAVTSSIKYYPQVLSWQHTALPTTGAFVIHTNITASSHEMFEIKVHGYNYQGAGMIDFTIGGYAYATLPRSISGTGSAAYGSITDNGSDGYRKWLGMDADGYVSIAIGDYDLSHQQDHYFWNLSVDFWSLRDRSDPYVGDPWSVELSAVEGFEWTDIRGVYGQPGVPMTAPITSKATWGNSWVMINTGSSGGASNPPLYTLDVNGDIRVSDDLFVDDFASLDSCRIGTTQTDPGTGNLVVEGNVSIDQYIFHNDDDNTYIQFTDDEIVLYAGGRGFIKCQEASTDKLMLNYGSLDIDVQVKGENEANLIRTDAANDLVGIGTSEPNARLSVSGSEFNGLAIEVADNHSTYFQISGSEQGSVTAFGFTAATAAQNNPDTSFFISGTVGGKGNYGVTVISGDLQVSGNIYNTLGDGATTIFSPYLAQQILNPSSYSIFTITNDANNLYKIDWDGGHTSTTDPAVTFTAPPSGKVLVDVQVYVDDTSTSGPGPYVYFALSTSTSANISKTDASIVGAEKIYWYPDEADDEVHNFTIYADGLTAGTSYTWYLFTRRYSDGDTNRIICGGQYPAMIMQVRPIMDNADIYTT